MAMSCWKTLGIEPTKDVIAIKRAYTSLAHKINPEDEPDKFRELHDAYRLALDYAKSEGIRISFVPAQSDTDMPHKNKVTSEFKSSSVTNTSSDKNEETDETPKDEFDFSSLNTDQLDSSELNSIIDGIVNFRERNRLTTNSEITGIPFRIRITLAQNLFTQYQRLAEYSNDTSIWNSYIDEPLIRNCITYADFREWLFKVLDENTVEQLNLRETIEKLGKEERNSDIHEIDIDEEKEKRQKLYIKGVFVPLLVCFIITVIFIFLNIIGVIEFDDLIVIIIASIWIISGIIILCFLLYQYGDKRVRSGG